MIEKNKYVIKNKNNNLYLSPYNHGEHWVEINNAQVFDIETGKEKPEDLVDLAWIIDEDVEIKKVKMKIFIEEIKTEKIKKNDYIISEKKFKKIKNILKSHYKNNDYNNHGTKIKKINILQHLIYNLIRDKFYLNGIILSKNKFFTTSENINKAKNVIYEYKNNLNIINKEFEGLLEINELELISKKLKKQIEE